MKKIFVFTLFVSITVFTNAQMISGGYGHTLVICADSTVKAFGLNITGELGNGTTSSSNVPVSVLNLTSIVQVGAGDNFSIALKADGTVWTWGNNGSGQLGIGSFTDSSVPVQVPGLSGMVGVSAGGSHAIAVKDDGTLWTWGNNNSGQAGDGTAGINSNVPTIVLGSEGFIKVAASGNHNLALKSDGTVWAMGSGFFGMLGTGTTNSSSVLVQSLTLPGVTDIACGQNFSMALNADSTVSSWGLGSLGQLGNGSTATVYTPTLVDSLTEITHIAHGSFGLHGIARKADGTLWAWGNNDYGQLGDGTLVSTLSPIHLTLPGDFVQASLGNIHSILVKSDGTVWTWGRNNWGQVGNGTNTDTTIPAIVPGLCLVAQPCSNTTSTIDVIDVDSYVSPSGVTYTTSGVYTDIISNAAGCDSIITIKLTLGHTGLNETNKKLVSLYPNPASHNITILGFEELDGIVELQVLSISGAKVLRPEVNSPTINISSLERGVYFIQIKHEGGMESIRFLKE